MAQQPSGDTNWADKFLNQPIPAEARESAAASLMAHIEEMERTAQGQVDLQNIRPLFYGALQTLARAKDVTALQQEALRISEVVAGNKAMTVDPKTFTLVDRFTPGQKEAFAEGVNAYVTALSHAMLKDGFGKGGGRMASDY